MDARPVSLSDMVSPSEWAHFHGMSISQTYQLIRAERLDALNISAGDGRPTYVLRLRELPKQPDRSRDASASAPHAGGQSA